MTTLADFKKFETLKQELTMFLYEKCTEYEEAKCFDIDDFYKYCVLDDNLDDWDFEDLVINVWIYNSQQEDHYCYKLPLDILFDSDFKQKMKARFEEERERESLALIEKRKQHTEEYEKLRARAEAEEISKLKELMGKYPEIVKDGETS